MSIVWDSVLVAATARALHERLEGERVRALHFDFEARRVRLHLREHTLMVLLHPDDGGLVLAGPAEPPADARPLAARVRSVTAPPDDRILYVELSRLRGRPSRVELVVELMTNQWNAAYVEGEARTVRTVLRTREGDREVRVGRPWTPPPPSDRSGVEAPVPLDRWLEALLPVEPRRRKGALLSTFAWTSPLTAPVLLGAAAGADAGPAAARAALEAGWTAWTRLGEVARGERAAQPVVLRGPGGAQPYPLPLPGREASEATDLLSALQRAADLQGTAAVPTVPARTLAALERQAERARARLASLEEELADLPDAEALQALGDLLLARFGDVPAGEASVTLADFEGQHVVVELDPARGPHENAAAYYDRAARVRRARERLPRLIDGARSTWRDLEALLDRAREGDASVEEIEAVLPERSEADDDQGPTLPYRRYRSSGGLEIRVGRGARFNDDLTFHHSAPSDIWLHARHTAGAHVVLRWPHDGNPPARDLAEAAVLAALHSKARTSGSVPVDWTLRKYVRKPRKAPPGSVVPDRVQTLFVAPDPALEERLRDD